MLVSVAFFLQGLFWQTCIKSVFPNPPRKITKYLIVDFSNTQLFITSLNFFLTDALLQTVSDSTDIFKDTGQKEGEYKIT